ncbi:MAG: phosphotransferase [Oscillospiraceae bacterium]|nr:phosphotransferase [Oscillospiraceae bacterium]
MSIDENLCFDITDALRLYGVEEPGTYEISDNSHGDGDKRFTIFASCPKGEEIVIKAARNSFTTPERVEGWAELTEHYNNLGVYAPRFLRSADGEYGTYLGDYCIYAEEFAKYSPDETISREASAEALLTSLGRVAANPAQSVPWPSPYAMFDKFCTEYEVPEIYENALNIMREVREKFPEYESRTAAIMKEYERRRAEFEPVYRALPKAVFQADMNNTNLLFNGGEFVGLMDFNLSGTDAILDYAFYESCYFIKSDLDGITQGDPRIISVEERIRRNFAYVAREYAFNDAERAAFNTFYNLAFPFWGHNFVMYKKWIHDHGALYIPQILDFIEFHMTRTDISLQDII